MFSRHVKLLIVFSALMGGYLLLMSSRPARAYSSGPDVSLTGSPGLGATPAEDTCTACHNSFALNSGPGKLTVTGMPVSYVPGQKYSITVSLNQASRARYGFQATILDGQGNRAGTISISSPGRTQLLSGSVGASNRQYVEHTIGGVGATSTNQADWTFDWTAPSNNVGKVSIYVAGNAANGSSTEFGDYIYNTSVSSTFAPVTVSSADYVSGNPVPSGGAASLFGVNLATSSQLGSGSPPATTLAGTTVSVKDSLGVSRAAGIFYASPTQINFLMPDATAAGVATITVTAGDGTVSAGTVTVAAVQPGIFTLTSDGRGIPVSQIQRVRGTTDLGFESTFTFTGTAWATVPITWNDPNDSVYLVLYANGTRKNSGLSAASATIAGTTATIVYAGPQGFFPGVDQVNILLPRSLQGKGDVNLTITIDGKTSNTVTVNIK